MENKKIGLLEKFGFGLFSISCNIVIQFVSTFILFYYTDVFHISPAIAGGIISFGIIWDGINDPLIASYADNHVFKNGERVRPYALYFCLPLAVTTVLMFSPVPITQALKPAYAVFMYIIFYSLTTILRLPSYAMPMLATSDTKERISINTFVSGGATLGGVLASVLCWPLVRLFGGINGAKELINPQRGFILGSMVIGLFIIVGSLSSYFTTKERVKPLKTSTEKISIIKSFKMLMKNYNFCWNAGFATLYFVNNALLTACLVYYTKYVLFDSGKTTLIMGIFAAGSLASLPFVKKIETKFGRRKSMMFGAGLAFLSKIPFILNPYSLTSIILYALVMGISVTINIVMFSTNRADISDMIEHEHGRRIDSMVINLTGFLTKCGSSLTSLFIGIGLQAANYNASSAVQPESAINTLIIFMGYAALFASALMFICASKITIESEIIEKSSI